MTDRHNPSHRGDCSFCGQAPPQVFRIISGPGVYICNECVYLCLEILEEEPRNDYVASLKAEVQRLLLKLAKPPSTAGGLEARAAEARVNRLQQQISVLEASTVPPDVLRAELNRVEGERERASNVLFEQLARAVESNHPGMPNCDICRPTLATPRNPR